MDGVNEVLKRGDGEERVGSRGGHLPRERRRHRRRCLRCICKDARGIDLGDWGGLKVGGRG